MFLVALFFLSSERRLFLVRYVDTSIARQKEGSEILASQLGVVDLFFCGFVSVGYVLITAVAASGVGELSGNCV